MPTVTRTVAKGIPPRKRSPAKPKHKAKASKSRKNLKRQVDSNNDKSPSETSNSEDSEPKAKKKRLTKRQRKESSEEVVEVDNPTKWPVEEVEDIGTTSDDNSISVTPTEMEKDSHIS